MIKVNKNKKKNKKKKKSKKFLNKMYKNINQNNKHEEFIKNLIQNHIIFDEKNENLINPVKKVN